MISIILVEDSNKDRESIVTQLKDHADFKIKDFGHDGYDALKLVQKYKPDIVILDLCLNFFDEIEVSHLLKRYSPETSVVLMSSIAGSPMIKRSVGDNISAYLLKEEDLKDLAVILRKVKAGEMYVNPHIVKWVFKLLADSLPVKQHIKHQDFSMLNKKEIQILQFIGRGFSSKEMAVRLRLKDGTTRNYISNVMRKTGFRNRAQLIHYAIVNGFIDVMYPSEKCGNKAAVAGMPADGI